MYLIDQCTCREEIRDSIELRGGRVSVIGHLSQSDLPDLVSSSLARVFSGKFENLRLFSFWKFVLKNFGHFLGAVFASFSSPFEGFF